MTPPNGKETTLPNAACQSMRAYAPELTQYFSERGVSLVRLEYWGGEERGCAEVLFLSRADGSPYHIDDPARWRELKTIFMAILAARCPDWSAGNGSCGDFCWDVGADSLCHSHYTFRDDGNERTTHHGL